MRMRFTCKSPAPSFRSERGAALITMLLISTLLLAAGGVLILTTTMSGTNTIDATAEMHAYYAAEAGLQRTLNILRGNEAPAGTKETFLKTIFSTASTDHRLTSLLPYNDPTVGTTVDGTPAIAVGNNGAYSVWITDPGPTAPGAVPSRLNIQVTGYGPRRARKVLNTLVIQAGMHGFQATGSIMIRCADIPPYAPPSVLVDTGSSNRVKYSGVDASNPRGPGVSAFTTNADCVPSVNGGIQRPTQVVTPSGIPGVGVLGLDPEWLQNADLARSHVEYLREFSNPNPPPTTPPTPSRYFTSLPPPSQVHDLTFVEGDATFGPGDNGSGVLVVTGTLNMQGNSNFDGLIMVLGGGTVTRSGAGNGVISGGVIIAKFPADENDPQHQYFQAPVFTSDGAGASIIQYNSASVSQATSSLPGFMVIGVAEK